MIQRELTDTEWPFTYTDHERRIARAIVFDDEGYLYFLRVTRNDEFGNATLIETSGGGAEEGETLTEAVKRELREELGAETEVVRKLGVVSDYYNLIHRHNLNHYFLCRVIAFGERDLTEQEKNDFHLKTMRLTAGEAAAEYERCAGTKLGRLIANRELPILEYASGILRERDAENAEGETGSRGGTLT